MRAAPQRERERERARAKTASSSVKGERHQDISSALKMSRNIIWEMSRVSNWIWPLRPLNDLGSLPTSLTYVPMSLWPRNGACTINLQKFGHFILPYFCDRVEKSLPVTSGARSAAQCPLVRITLLCYDFYRVSGS